MARPTITAVRFDSEQLILAFDSGAPAPVRLVGPREVVEAAALDVPAAASSAGSAAHTQMTSGRTVVRCALTGTRWGTPGLALPTGTYRLWVGDPGTDQVAVVPETLPALQHPLFEALLGAESGGLSVHIGPAGVGEGSHGGTGRLHAPRRGGRELENSVYFESFHGNSASCNPIGIDRELRRLEPDLVRYWSVADGSKAVPDGGVRVVEGSSEWHRARARSRVYVVNDWLRPPYPRARGQRVLQTWHGTMLKRLALDRFDSTLRTRVAVIRQQARWDALLSQNPYSTEIFRRAYRARCPIWELGYPRNDVLADPARIAAIRSAIGLPAGIRAVLYAPTWRDDRQEIVDHVDLAELSAALPDDHVLMVRGHSRTLAYGQDLRGDRLIDVTSYPDVAEIMAVSDVLVTDYSSVMFDFAVTGRPMIFFTPDIQHYEQTLRGFYFDLLSRAPGPVVSSRADLLDAIRDADRLADTYAAARAAWSAEFVPLDDGLAGARVVQQMIDEGWFS